MYLLDKNTHQNPLPLFRDTCTHTVSSHYIIFVSLSNPLVRFFSELWFSKSFCFSPRSPTYPVSLPNQTVALFSPRSELIGCEETSIATTHYKYTLVVQYGDMNMLMSRADRRAHAYTHAHTVGTFTTLGNKICFQKINRRRTMDLRWKEVVRQQQRNSSDINK